MSILNTTKKLLKGIDPDCTDFDDEIIPLINGNLRILNQLGVGEYDVEVEDETTTWHDFLGDSERLLSTAKTWMGLKVDLIFDPPNNSYLQASIEKQIDQLEWRMRTASEFGI